MTKEIPFAKYFNLVKDFKTKRKLNVNNYKES